MAGAATVALVLVIAGAVRAGPLDPPGAPGPTMKTLAEVEPRTPISELPIIVQEPGSYYLTKNLVVPDGTAGIVIEAPDVTIDLNGYTVSGATANTAGIFGNLAGASRPRVFNGTITNVGAGIYLPGPQAQVYDVTVSVSVSTGIFVGPGSTLTGCSVSGGIPWGIEADRSVVSECTARGAGSEGVPSSGGLHVIDSTLRDCGATNNLATGIAASGSIVERCVVFANGGAGIVLTLGASTVRNNQVTGNFSNGIEVHANHSLVVGNVTQGNGTGLLASGIWSPGSYNRIEENHADGPVQGWGLYVNGTSNFVVNNSATENTVAQFALFGSGAYGPQNSPHPCCGNDPLLNMFPPPTPVP